MIPKETLLYLSKRFDLHPIITETLCKRGINTEEKLARYLFPHPNDLLDPYLFNDMKIAVERILKAIQNNETIVIFGDYDVDGITSTTSLYLALKEFNANVFFKVPLRHEGYGISTEAVDDMHHRHHPSLIITVDNGSTAFDALSYAKQLGIDVIVTDHHDMGDTFPECVALITPKRFDSTYPFSHLCGAGVVFKVIHALYLAQNIPWEQNLWKYIEFASIGTIADMVPLIDENRSIASLGLRKLNANPSAVFDTMLSMVKAEDWITSSTIGFRIAPVFNASGRIGDPNISVRLLTGESTSPLIIQELISNNEKRKQMTFEQMRIADSCIIDKKLYKDPIIVVDGDFHDGLIGLISARISQKYKKASIVISGNGKGSARSIPNSTFSIIEAIKSCQHLLKRFGGHPGAAGLSIDLTSVELFRKQIQKAYELQSFSHLDHSYDSIIAIKQFPATLLDELKMLEPCGMGNPQPVFLSPFTYIRSADVFGRYDKHLKLSIDQYRAFSFMKGDQLSLIQENKFINLLYSASNKHELIVHELLTKIPS